MAQKCSDILAGAASGAAPHQAVEGLSRIAAVIRAQHTDTGGFRGRSSASELYYSYFALQALLALGEPLPAVALATYLRGFGGGEDLKFADLACLAGAWAAIEPNRRDDATLRRIEEYRASDGGYAEKRQAREASAYGCFLALMAYEFQQASLPDPDAFRRAVQSSAPTVTTAVSARAILLSCLGAEPPASVAELLMARASKRGGFRAAPLAPIADLLSTATALCALRVMQQPLDAIREPCLDFVDGLWHDSGGFCGHWVDRTPDCEYTYYALISLGILAS